MVMKNKYFREELKQRDELSGKENSMLRINLYLVMPILLILFVINNLFGQTAKEYYKSGENKFMSEDYKGAIEELTKAIDLNPYFTLAYKNRGVTKWYLKDFEGSISDLNKAIELKPDYADAYLNRGISKANPGDFKGAIEDYDKAIEIYPNDAYAYNNRGLAKYMIDDFSSACADWYKAKELGDKEVQKMINEYCNERECEDESER